MTAIEKRLAAPVPPASLVCFRAVFGTILFVATIRFLAEGRVAEHFIEPRHFFHYLGFKWVHPLPGIGMYLVYAAMAAAAIGIAVGFLYRLSVAIFGMLFVYAQLCDKTHYLNHYYLVVLLLALLLVAPLHAAGSLDARRRPSLRRSMPVWALLALRAQLGLVYFFAGVAKLQPDWLVAGEPLRTWMAARGLPIELAPFASWVAAVFDLTIPFWLLWRRTRAAAYAVVVLFHVATALSFPIGIFPWMMIALTPIFFAPDWPERFGLRFGVPTEHSFTARSRSTGRFALALVTAHLAFQLALPLRALAYPGNVLWTEEGFRFSWRVMVMEKSGTAWFEIHDPDTDHIWELPATELYTRYQAAMMATQPDMLLEAAQTAAAEMRARGVRAPQVFVHAFASLGGRPSARLVDPHVDLAHEADGFAVKPWILPLQ